MLLYCTILMFVKIFVIFSMVNGLVLLWSIMIKVLVDLLFLSRKSVDVIF